MSLVTSPTRKAYEKKEITLTVASTRPGAVAMSMPARWRGVMCITWGPGDVPLAWHVMYCLACGVLSDMWCTA